MYLRHCSDDLDSNFLVLGPVPSTHDLAKSTLPKQIDQAIPFTDHAVLLDNVVAIFIINLLLSLVALRRLLVSVLLARAWFGWVTYVVQHRHMHLSLLLVLLRRRHVFAVLGQITSWARSLNFLLFPLLL